MRFSIFVHSDPKISDFDFPIDFRKFRIPIFSDCIEKNLEILVLCPQDARAHTYIGIYYGKNINNIHCVD